MEGELIKLKQKFPEIAWKTKQNKKKKEERETKKLSQDKIVFGVHDVSSCVLKSDLHTTFFKMK